MEKRTLQRHANHLMMERAGDIPSLRSREQIERELRAVRRMIDCHDEETVNEPHSEFDTLKEREIHYMEP